MVPIDVISQPRSAAEVLTWSRGLVDPAMRAAVGTLPTSMRRVAGYHFGWWDADGTPRTGDAGKAIRPTLAMLCAETVGGSVVDAVPAAVAVELVHNFSLLHDDVMDRDVSRRHRPTAWTVFGVSPAILAGDALLTLAFDVLAGSGHPRSQDAMRMVSAAVQDLVEGQCEDVSFEERSDVDLSECLSMAGEKTGALLACSTAVGALFGGGSAAQAEHMRVFGEHLGLAFQLVDDLLGIWGDPQVTGKPVHSDLVSRKKSLPVVAALTSGEAAAEELAALYGRQDPLSDRELSRAAELVELAGGRSWTQREAADQLDLALAELTLAAPVARATAELTALARLITRRDH
ncbi:family 2 encapsulin nanocompartment cargo protein polyprenyl transferase [Kutzneria kofuensis]|uniref:Geranylgeranyl diphosphate synthase type I n=1 Tax=Kutzneria kofuensis TaxID=103725 RepID=A0A7W9KG74_9PSEU|nr:family 2 encapsulin nanocompartment cargo protein polyprenyl transferase [Kutzneria kofuensis]MBB5892018.1 geranylgeranyl diphosphate synthase type I [Kutzneria kofuensis]